MSALFIGQRVELIKAYSLREQALAAAYGFVLRELRVIYTIRGFYQETHLLLVEIVNPAVPYVDGDMEPVFLAERFRPIVEHKTDISIFTALLMLSREGADA